MERKLVANLPEGKSRACRKSGTAVGRNIGSNITTQRLSSPIEETYPDWPQTKLEESAKATIQSNSGAEPENQYSAYIHRPFNVLSDVGVEIQSLCRGKTGFTR